MQLEIKKAERKQKKAKILLSGPAKSGKTLTALRMARGLVGPDGKIFLLDSEKDSATLFANDPDFHCDFDHANLPNYEHDTYIGGLYQAAKLGYSVVIIDSLSHGWEAILERHTQVTLKMTTPNSFTAWSTVTPMYTKLINAILAYPGHTIVTARAKTQYVLEENAKGKQTPKKVGMSSILRPGAEYEFDLIGRLDVEHNLVVEGTRYRFLDGMVINKPGEDLGQDISAWLASGKAKEPDQAPQKSKGKKQVVESEYDVTRETHPYAYNVHQTGLSEASEGEKRTIWKTLKEKYGAVALGDVIRTQEAVPGWEDYAVTITED